VQALEHLKATDDSIVEVAASTGFADQAHLTRAITTLTGRSPGKWRAWVKFVQDALQDELAC
jgi:transcriptional regulator GlxA family with amidase domain